MCIRDSRKLLLERLSGLPADRRSAHFVCALVLVAPGGRVVTEVLGRTHGRILGTERGTGGFGYDPLFQFDEPADPVSGRSFAELTPADKDRVSHRGRALEELLKSLPQLDLGAN